MELEAALTDITERLRQGRFPNEQAISQGIVLRLLQVLGWDTWDPAIVWPEYQTGEGRADFALCHPPSKPAVFIEVKQPGRAEDAVRQALGYAFHVGVRFAVLTDGQTWSFYLPAEPGPFEERRFCRFDLFKHLAAKAAEDLCLYLARVQIESGQALKTAHEALEKARKEKDDLKLRSQARAAIPGAWRDLAEKGDEVLVKLLADAVESKMGFRAHDDDVMEFLTKLDTSDDAAQPIGPAAAGLASQSRGLLILQGTEYPYNTAKEAMVIILRELAKRDPTFLERCSQDRRARGTTRRYIAHTPAELYHRDPKRYDSCEPLPGQWLVATNNDTAHKKSIIQLAAEVAGLTLGTDLIVDL